jgi:hypothetical protein
MVAAAELISEAMLKEKQALDERLARKDRRGARRNPSPPPQLEAPHSIA